MVELVDTPDLGSGAAMRVGSSPIRRTTQKRGVIATPLFFSLWPMSCHMLSEDKFLLYYQQNAVAVSTEQC